MRISVKGRYGIISTIIMAQKYENENTVTLISIAENLGISKIYLEQVFSLLKRGGIVTSVKGAQGGYKLAKKPREISVYDILFNIENAMFEETSKTLEDNFEDLEKTLAQAIYTPLTEAMEQTLKGITLADLTAAYEKNKSDDGFMYYI